jgi:elongation factor G
VLGATTGVEVGTEKVWEYCEPRGIPRLFFVSMMDKEHANFDKVRRDPSSHDGARDTGGAADRRGRGFPRYREPVHGTAHIFKPGTITGEYEETISRGAGGAGGAAADGAVRVDRDDERRAAGALSGGRRDHDGRSAEGDEDGDAGGELFPIFCGAAEKTWGVRALLEALVEIVPSRRRRRTSWRSGPGLDQVWS